MTLDFMAPYKPTIPIGMIHRNRQNSEADVLGSESQDDGGEEAADATTVGSMISLSSSNISCQGRMRASSFAGNSGPATTLGAHGCDVNGDADERTTRRMGYGSLPRCRRSLVWST